MDRSVAQTLTGLIPSLTGPLPRELVELAVSLLAQSRSKASSLKAEEEIARSYACANLACERLKQTFNLPKIEPRPPCPPKVYQKLYKYLDGTLPARERRSSHLARTNGPLSTSTSSPTKARTPVKAMPLRPNTPKRKTPQRLAITSLEVPEWVMPAIRQLCKKMGVPAAPHHIFAGVSSILSASSSTSVKTPALIVAIYFFVTTRLSGTAFSSAKYPQLRSRALEILEGVAGEDAANNVIDGADIDECMRQVKSRQWTEMDWFANVPAGDGVGADEGTDEAQGEGLSDEDAEEGHLLPLRRRIFGREDSSGQDYLQAGLGTMMQDRVDYLSDDRRREYREWKKNILLQIEELKKSEDVGMEAG